MAQSRGWQLDSLQQELDALLTRAKHRVAVLRDGKPAPTEPLSDVQRRPDAPLSLLASRYGLSSLERDLLFATAAPHLDPRVLPIYRELRGAGFWDGVELRLLLSLFADCLQDQLDVRRALAGDSTLVRRALVAVRPSRNSPSLLHWTVETPPRLVHFLAGDELVGPPPLATCDPEPARVPLDEVQMPEGARQAALAMLQGGLPDRPAASVVIAVQGPPGTGKTALAAALAEAVGRPLLRARPDVLATPAAELPGLLDCLRLDVELADGILLVEGAEQHLRAASPTRAALLRMLATLEAPAVLEIVDAEALDAGVHQRIDLALDLPLPDAAAREAIWARQLAHAGEDGFSTDPDVSVTALASGFHFTGAEIATAVRAASHLCRHTSNPRAAFVLDQQLLARAAEMQLRASLQRYSITLPGRRSMADIVLHDDTEQQVQELLAACRHRHVVMDAWGFRGRLSTGHGIVSLFDGPPGTGKTFCAEIIGTELSMPVARINIPSIVSKWVGETEQHIADIFRRGRSARAILLFDEADSLFGARVGETKSATDRYANMSVNLLLQEIERYDGIVILTTNLVHALDGALLRRVQFRITFPELEAAHRGRIFASLLARQGVADAGIDFERLGETFALSGGRIQNAVLRAAYRAASEDAELIAMKHLVRAAAEEARAAGVLVHDVEALLDD